MTELIASAEPGLMRSSERPTYDRKAIGLCLSGGGYRATLFHTGVLLRLNEFGLLSKISRISSVSGGSITSAILAMNWDQLGYSAPGDICPPDTMHRALVEPVLKVTSTTLDVSGGLLGLLPWKSAGNVLADKYDDVLFGGKLLSELTRAKPPLSPLSSWAPALARQLDGVAEEPGRANPADGQGALSFSIFTPTVHSHPFTLTRLLSRCSPGTA